MKILSLRILPDNTRSLRAFADVELPGGIILRDLRVVEPPGKRPHVLCPQVSFKDPSSGQLIYKTVVTLPDRLMGELELLVLNEWNREKERKDAPPSSRRVF